MIQQAFVDMENMFELLEEKPEVICLRDLYSTKSSNHYLYMYVI